MNTSCSILLTLKFVLFTVQMFSALENNLSDEADEAEIARICLASLASIGYLPALTLQKSKMSTVFSAGASPRYLSTSFITFSFAVELSAYMLLHTFVCGDCPIN